jgi:hypothetical protein
MYQSGKKRTEALRQDMKSMTRTALAALMVAGAAVPLLLWAQQGQVITPLSAYSDPGWRGKAGTCQGQFARMQSELGGKLQAGQYQLLTTAESSVGGIGLWPNPVNFDSPARYFAVFMRVQVPPPSTGRAFPDTQTGRVMMIMDAYGKATISVLSTQLKSVNDPQVAGGAMIFIYGKKPVTDPSFEQSAEAIALFMKKDSVIAFAELRMTLQTLFSQSEMLPILEGQDQIQNLRMYIIQP